MNFRHSESEKADTATCAHRLISPTRKTIAPGRRTNQIIVLLLAVGGLVLFNVGCDKPTANVAPVEVINPEAIRPQAEAGDAKAQWKLGVAYAKGEGVKPDYKQALHWYRLAADQGLADAQLALGELYEAGQGAPRDFAEAVRWYRPAAEKGQAAAQYSLAMMYFMGTGVTKDDAEALKWYRASAEQGYPYALFNLGVRYQKGQGVTADPAEAFKWLTLAAEHGVAEAVSLRDEVKRTMTGEQVAEGRRRAAAFTAKHSTQPAQ